MPLLLLTALSRTAHQFRVVLQPIAGTHGRFGAMLCRPNSGRQNASINFTPIRDGG
jgi:hypothetical protein